MKKILVSVFVLFFIFLVNAWGIGPYIDNGDGTVTDQGTGLMWQKSNNEEVKTWQVALASCENLTVAGYEDWRLPNIRELRSIVKYDIPDIYLPAINTAMFDCETLFYWSSTTDVLFPNLAWGIHFMGGNLANSDKTTEIYGLYKERCVRGYSDNLSDTGQSKCYDNNSEIECPLAGEAFYGQDGNYEGILLNFLSKEVNEDNVVEDLNTKLTWQKSDDGVKRSWQNAVAYCQNLTFAGYNGWRLPTIFELKTIVDFGGYGPALIQGVFDLKYTSTNDYWSFTPHSYYSDMSWAINFYSGEDFWAKQSEEKYLICVHNGLSDNSSSNACTVDNPEGCNTEVNCIGAGGYWYNNECNSNEENVSLSIQQGWCLKSIPGKSNNSINMLTVFNNDNISTIWKWSGNSWKIWSPDNNTATLINSYGIATISGISSGEGFWINAKAGVNVSISGSSGEYGVEELTVNTGWNLLGVGKDTTVSDLNTLGDFSTVWKWTGNGWQIWSPKSNIMNLINNYKLSTINIIGKGEGFWVNKQ